MRDVVILGSTGSIGTQALEVVAEHRDQFQVVGLAAGGQQIALLAQQALDSGARTVAVSRATTVQDLQLALYAEASRRGWAEGKFTLPRILAGPDAAAELAAMPCDVVLNGSRAPLGLQQRWPRCELGGSSPWPTKSLWWSVVRWSPKPHGQVRLLPSTPNTRRWRNAFAVALRQRSIGSFSPQAAGLSVDSAANR